MRNATSPLARVARRPVDGGEDEVAEIAKPVLIDLEILLDDAAGGMITSMPSWSDFEAAAPELAARVRERLDAHRHKTIATIRADGAPRISGIEAQVEDGELWIGSDRDALKARDLLRDPRFALHSGSDDPPADAGQASSWAGDAKLAGIAVEEPQPDHLRFRLDIREASTVHVDGDKLAIEVWNPGRGVRRITR